MENGVLMSPNFPQNYPYNFECSWPIHAAENTTIRLQFTNFSVSTFQSKNSLLQTFPVNKAI